MDEYNEFVDMFLPQPVITSSRVNIRESGSGDSNIKSWDLTQLKDRVSSLGTVQDHSNEAQENDLEQNADEKVSRKAGMNSNDNSDQPSLEETNQREFQSFDTVDYTSQTSSNEAIDEDQGSANFTASEEEANGEDYIGKIAPRNTKCKARGASRRREMVEHKCSYSFFFKTFKTLKLPNRVRERIFNSPFGHFLDFLELLRFDLLDD